MKFIMVSQGYRTNEDNGNPYKCQKKKNHQTNIISIDNIDYITLLIKKIPPGLAIGAHKKLRPFK